jgi:hypothetical protein
MQITKNCIINGMPEDVYHKDPTPELVGFKESSSLSSTTLRTLLESTEIEGRMSIKRFNPVEDGGDESSDSVNFGTIAHDYVLLSGSKAVFEIVPFKDFRTDEARRRRDDLIKRGIIPLAQNEKTEGILLSLKTMKDRLHDQIADHRDWSGIMQKGMPEQSAFAFDGTIWNRSRMDWLDGEYENLIVDYKTTGLDFAQWEKNNLWDMYYLQDPHYRRVLDLINGKDAKPARFIFVVQQVKKPFLVQIFEIDKSYHDTIESRYLLGRQKFVNCLRTGIWRGIAPYTASTTPPTWIETRWEMDQLNEDFIAHREKEEKEQESKDVLIAC